MVAAGAVLGVGLAGCSASAPASHETAAGTRPVRASSTLGSVHVPASAGVGASTSAVPRFEHVVVVVEENHAFGEVIGSSQAPFIDQLASTGAVLTQSYAVAHPSEPNYLALFSGSTQGVSDDSCPHRFTAANLATAVIGAGGTFTGYSESLPFPGYTGCSAGAYARKHNPWVDFPAVPADDNQPMTAFPTDFSQLPTVAFVIPDLDHDMHDGTVSAADSWLQNHLAGYAEWAPSHNSLLVLTADEDDSAQDNRIPTVLVGAHVTPGTDSQKTDHYGLLATLLDTLRLPPLARSANASPLTGIWSS